MADTIPPTAEPTTKKRFPLWIMVVVLGLIPTLCLCALVTLGGLTLLGQRVETTFPTTGVLATGETFVSTDGISQVRAPTSWATRTDLNEKAELQIGNPLREEYLIVLTESKADFDGITLDEYADILITQFVEKLTDVTASEPRSLEINGRPAIQYQVTGTVDKLKVTYWLTGIEGDQHFHQVLAWTLTSRSATSGPVLQSVIESFEEVGQ